MSITFSNYGQERELNATPEELKIAEWIINEYPDEGLRLVRMSDDYVTVKRGEWDIVRLKYTPRAKWLMFPTLEAKQKKHYIDNYEEIEDFEATIKDSLEIAKKY